ncbi:MAG: hypothetical protein DRQ06_06480 [Candidatus Hydrothermota bacterium]|nr:MAG: hypothetical protein DRQ06_06480 [Candidatus Hydrothermae bacterium]
MRHITKSSMVAAFFVISTILLNISVLGEPVVNSVSIEPEEPTLKSNVTVTVNFSWSNITSVTLIMNECSAILQQCFEPAQRTDMSLQANGEYSGSVKLTRDETTYIQYYFEVNVDNETYEVGKFNPWKVNLSLNNENQNGGTSNGGESNKGTPGFELVLVLTALFIGIIYYKRKR